LCFFAKDVSCTEVVIRNQDDSNDLSPRLKNVLGSYQYITGSKENFGSPIYFLTSRQPFKCGPSFLYYGGNDGKWRGTVIAIYFGRKINIYNNCSKLDKRNVDLLTLNEK
jgi:hypothetical protein